MTQVYREAPRYACHTELYKGGMFDIPVISSAGSSAQK